MNEIIQVVKFEKYFSDNLSHFFRKNGYKVHQSFNGKSAIRDFERINPHIVLLGVILPDIDGFKLCKEFKKRSKAGIVFLTPLLTKNNILAAYHSGADDYITIPFDPDILLFRVNALTKRVLPNSENQSTVAQIGSLNFDLLKNDILHNDRYANLTPAEFRIIFYLASKKGYCSNSELLEQLYDAAYTNLESRTVSVHMSKIRKKIENLNLHWIQIKSKYKTGYMLLDAGI